MSVTPPPNINTVTTYLKAFQDRLCQAITTLEPSQSFVKDHWHYDGQRGGGRTHILSDGDTFERAGVGFSHIRGTQLPSTATQARPVLANRTYEATGVSAVIHPQNPYVPTSHLNIRFFIATDEAGDAVWWFGGGYDLTPYYGFEEDCIHWHQTAQTACDAFDPQCYQQFKQQCDQYFYLPHRQEPRGIGGIFFDDLNTWGHARCFDFLKTVGDSFIDAYLPIAERRRHHPYGLRERHFQQYRRGRYVEFNLLQDRGTLFGIQSQGRTESILMSMPPTVRWAYQHTPEPGSAEAKLYSDFLVPRDWANHIL